MHVSSKLLFAVGQEIFITGILCVCSISHVCLNFRDIVHYSTEYALFLCLHGHSSVGRGHRTVERKSDHLYFSLPRAQQVSPSLE